MPARITMNLNASGEFELWLNPEGRDALVKKLQGLSETSDHFHLGPQSLSEVEVSDRPYRSDDQLLMWGLRAAEHVGDNSAIFFLRQFTIRNAPKHQ